MKNILLAPLLLALSLFTSSLTPHRPIEYTFTQEVPYGDYTVTIPAEFVLSDYSEPGSIPTIYKDYENNMLLSLRMSNRWWPYTSSGELLSWCKIYAGYVSCDEDTSEFVKADECMGVLICSDVDKSAIIFVVNRYETLYIVMSSMSKDSVPFDGDNLRDLSYGILDRIVAPEQPLREEP